MTRPSFQPVKPCDPELPKAAVRRLVNQNGGVKRTAVKLGLSTTQTYAVTDPGAPDELSFARAAALTSHETPAAAEYLALLAGGVFLPIECASGVDVRGLTANVAREHGDAIGALIAAMADNRITPAEARSALVEVDDCLRTLCGLRSLLLKAIDPSD
jgi:hypothetical protein